MHYKNGREAKNGDKVLLLSDYHYPIVGVIYDIDTAVKVAPIPPSHLNPNLKECLHLDDVLESIDRAVPLYLSTGKINKADIAKVEKVEFIPASDGAKVN